MRLPAGLDELAKADVQELPVKHSLNPSNPSPEAVAANHEVRIGTLEDGLEKIEKKLEWILRLAMGSLITAVLHMAGAYVTSLIAQHKP